MTLTRMIPSLRAILPDPLTVDFWPEATVATSTDVVVSGISLRRLVEVCGTPCTHSGAAVIPRTDGLPSATRTTRVLVVRVTRVGLHESGNPIAETDARLDELRLVWSQTRLIGRASTARGGTVLVALRPEYSDAAGASDSRPVELPLDLRPGDLLAIPGVPEETDWTGSASTCRWGTLSELQ
jgi:hypothetical protein